jgi:hypothetical protein
MTLLDLMAILRWVPVLFFTGLVFFRLVDVQLALLFLVFKANKPLQIAPSENVATRAQDKRSTPGRYRCSEDGDGTLLICNANHEWQISAICGKNPIGASW